MAGAYREAFSGLPLAVWTLCGVALIHRSGNMVLPFLTLYLTVERGFTAAQAGLIVGMYGVGSMGGSWLGGTLADRWEPRRAQLWSLGLGGAGMFALGPLRDPLALAAGVLVTSLIIEALRPANMAAIVRRVPGESRARAFALLRLAANIGWGVGPALGGVLAARDYGWLFVGNGLAAWLAAAVLFVAVPRARRGGPPGRGAGNGRGAGGGKGENSGGAGLFKKKKKSKKNIHGGSCVQQRRHNVITKQTN